MTKDEAMELALETLERIKRYGNTFGYRSHEQNPYEQVCEAITALREALAEQPAQQEPVAQYIGECSEGSLVQLLADVKKGANFYTSPPAQRKPLHIGEETAAFKAWFDAWWIGDGEQGEIIPTQSDKHFLTYLDQYTLGFGAWMAAKHAAHGIKENT